MAVKTFSVNEVLTAADTNTYLANSGLVFVKSETFAATNNLVIDDIFTTTFTNYRILFTVDTISASSGISFQFRDGTTNLNTSYFSAGMNVSVASAGITKIVSNDAGSELATVAYDNLDYSLAVIEIFRPKDTGYTMYTVSSTNYRPGELLETRQYNGAYQQTTTIEGIRFFTASATFAGKYAIYGYRTA